MSLRLLLVSSLVLRAENLKGDDSVDDKRAGKAGIPGQTGDQLAEILGRDAAENGERSQQEEEAAGETVHLAQQVDVDQLPGETGEDEVPAGARLGDDVADRNTAKDAMRGGQVGLPVCFLCQVDR